MRLDLRRRAVDLVDAEFDQRKAVPRQRDGRREHLRANFSLPWARSSSAQPARLPGVADGQRAALHAPRAR